jgi:ABC-type polysaccharide/polyol phosphate transport system ATPase subunit
MRGSEPSSAGSTVTISFGAGAPSVSVESVSRRYQQIRAGRTRRLFAVFGGIESDAGPIEEEDDDDDDDVLAESDDDLGERKPGDRELALADVSLRLSGPGCVSFVGPANSGKSVLLRVMAGVTPPDSGRVVVTGLLAPVLESLVNLLPRQGRAERGVQVLAALTRLPVRDVRRRLPDIFGFLGEPQFAQSSLSSVSSRRRRELLFATMLSLDADIVLVDCPIPPGALGERCRERLLELKERGALVVIAAATGDDAGWIADRVLYMRRGRVFRESGESSSGSAFSG